MVHQYRYCAKKYVTGTGRRALWKPVKQDDPKNLRPQYLYPLEKLPSRVQERITKYRAGFCDITGQTNERTMLASRIPSGAVCGNKVPTVRFGDFADQLTHIDCWLAIVNSIPFDWALRRVVTTTVNYFLLLELPLPPVSPLSTDGIKLALLSRKLSDENEIDAWQKAEVRAEIDWRVLSLFGHDSKTMYLLLGDFPLLDRAQPPLDGDQNSTVTRDLLLLRTVENLGGVSTSEVSRLAERVENAKATGALPYIPSHFVQNADSN